jgi:hypothetical protein
MGASDGDPRQAANDSALIPTSPENAKITTDSQSVLTLDALVRSIGVRRGLPVTLFLGAGASVTSGVPSAQMCIWEWKRQIFLTKNPGLENQFAELSLEGVKRRIQAWFDRQGSYPAENSPEEYGFYITQCFPIPDDRRAFFAQKVREAAPHIGYHLLCYLAQAGLVRGVWSTNFDGLSARAAAVFKLTPIEVGIDCQHRVIRAPSAGELLCVSLHGDYRYDQLKNTSEEIQSQETALRKALIEHVSASSLIVCGYSGRDDSIMTALRDAYAQPGTGALYWCGFNEREIPSHVIDLLQEARSHQRQAYYVTALGFDDLMTRLALYCLPEEDRDSVTKFLENYKSDDLLAREPFNVRELRANTLIKSNAFSIECPAEVLQFDLLKWPAGPEIWTALRAAIGPRQVVAVPFKRKVLALGTIDDIKTSFGGNVRGAIERAPVSPTEFGFRHGAIVSLMREAVTRSMAEAAGLPSDGRRELWNPKQQTSVVHERTEFSVFPSARLFLRRIGAGQYLVLKPSLKVLDQSGDEVSAEVADAIKLAQLGYQHNKQFNQAVNAWRELLFPKGRPNVFEFPVNCGSTFKFKVNRSPVFGQIGLPQGGPPINIEDRLRPLLRHRGLQLAEPLLVFSNRAGTGTVKGPHPIRGVVENRPYDYPLTVRGLSASLRLGVICPVAEAGSLASYLRHVNDRHSPTTTERDYLVDYPGFQTAYGLPLELCEPSSPGWATCPEPSSNDPGIASREIATRINQAIETLRSSYSPHLVLIFFPERWDPFRRYLTDTERFDVHDFVKAFSVERGIATQFLNGETLVNPYQCRVWWWLSLALYVKGIRTPWVLDTLSEDTAFAGLGFSIDRSSKKGQHVVLGCSHIYSAKGEGLQYRLSKIEEPIIRGENAFMSKDDARRTGETIRQLFFDARHRLPNRVVLHKRTAFTKDEREGLIDGLSGVRSVELLEIQIDEALRYVASVVRPDTRIDEDNYPVRRGTMMKLDNFTALLWVHGATTAINPSRRYFQGKRRIPAPLTIRRHAGKADLEEIAEEILGLSKMDWNTFDLYTKLPATLQSSNEIARIGSLLNRFGVDSYDYRLFI